MQESHPQGILLVNKSLGKPSFSLVSQLRKLTNVKKIGFSGTLDPLATGLMIMLIGKNYTKKADRLVNFDKEYFATIELGKTTNTLDKEGSILTTSPIIPTLAEVQNALESFQGDITQIPPMYCAKKIQGKKLYNLARKGITIDRKPIKVHIECELISYKYPYLTLNVTCSKGTYIRTLADDIGKKLLTGAYLFSLCRKRIGPFNLKDSIKQDNLKDTPLKDHLLTHEDLPGPK